MKNILFLLFVISIGIISCTKKDLPAPAPVKSEPIKPEIPKKDTIIVATPGTGFKASTKPAGAVAMVSITAFINNASITYTTVPDANGDFVFDHIQAGLYVINFTCQNNYMPLSNKTIAIESGKMSAMGELNFLLKTIGILRGAIEPLTAASKVTINGVVEGAPVSFSAIPDKDGKFSFDNIPPTTYMLNFDITPSYTFPAINSANVPMGQALDLGRISFAALADCGSVSGSIIPPGADVVAQLITSNGSGYLFRATPHPVTGAFRFDKVPKGDYSLRFATGSSVVGPLSKSITVLAGENIEAGSFTFKPNEVISYLSCKINGTGIRWQVLTSQLGSSTLNASFVNGMLTISNRTLGSMNYSVARQIEIKVDNVTGPGTYVFNTGGSSAYISYFDSRASQLNPVRSSNGGEGKVIITEIDAVKKTITGTFTGILFNTASPVPVKKEVTEGSFKVTYR